VREPSDASDPSVRQTVKRFVLSLEDYFALIGVTGATTKPFAYCSAWLLVSENISASEQKILPRLVAMWNVSIHMKLKRRHLKAGVEEDKKHKKLDQ
jgi:steroid 5-alpha reductase family enzyme